MRQVHFFRLIIQFHFGTKISEFGGDWPNEYHQAEKRLYGMFDHLEKQLLEGLTPLDDIRMKPVNGSLTYAPVKAVCDIGYSFNKTILMCGWYMMVMYLCFLYDVPLFLKYCLLVTVCMISEVLIA